ncbi:hypothetical protein DRQ53_12210 [bacterium]|nr:MAG: hypothetical protein DRQ53_12210 [bacterium]
MIVGQAQPASTTLLLEDPVLLDEVLADLCWRLPIQPATETRRTWGGRIEAFIPPSQAGASPWQWPVTAPLSLRTGRD